MEKVAVVVLSLCVGALGQKVGVDDDYYLNADVSFSCPLPIANVTSYSNVTDDGAVDDDYYGATLPADYPAFVFFYVWMIFMTLGPLSYFAYNNRVAPIGQMRPFTPESKSHFESDSSWKNYNNF
jgi:hypothetical protein